MYEIKFYEDRQGNKPTVKYIEKLSEQSETSKSERIKLKKITEYMRILKMASMSNNFVNSLTSWDDLEKTFNLTQDEWDEIDLKVKIVGEIINARQSQDITQQALEELSGVRQPVIARLESNVSDPQLTTILKILRPLGKTLAVVDISMEV